MKVAVFGCAHGMLNDMYLEVDRYEKDKNEKVDFIIVCGDCQTLRHKDDLTCINMPDKYKNVGDFPDYYSGRKKVPKLTLFVGGNHEASNYLMSLPYGGWVCENFYYLGYSNVIRHKGLRIAGISGIYNYHNANRGRYESLPLNEDSKRSIYHTRMLEVFRLRLLQSNIKDNPIDIFLSHDWPAKIYDHGDKKKLLRFKPHFSKDIESRQGLGNPLTSPLVFELKPKYWFAAHLHCKFTARVIHDRETNVFTDFLSLNKIGKGKMFMEIVDISAANPGDELDEELYYDAEWIAILKKTIELESKTPNNTVPCPQPNDTKYHVTKDDTEACADLINISEAGLRIPRNFQMSEPVIYNRDPVSCDPQRKVWFSNPQTDEFLKKIGLENQVPSATANPQRDSVSHTDEDRLTKRRRGEKEIVELDEDGCLPFYIDTHADI